MVVQALRPDPPRRRLHTDGLIVAIVLVALRGLLVGFAIGRAA